jgi:hypothetical protein
MATQTEVPLLQGDNYPVWVKAMKRHMKGAGLYDLINGERKRPKPPVVPLGSIVTSTTTDEDEPKCNDPTYLNYWYRYVADLVRFRGDSQRAQALILGSLHSSILMIYEEDDALEDPKALWDALADAYKDQAAKQDPMAGLTTLFETKRANFNSHAEYQSSLLANVALCKAAGTVMDDKLLATIVRNGLPDDPLWGAFRSEMMDMIEKGDCGLAKILQRMEVCDRYMPVKKVTTATDTAMVAKDEKKKTPRGEWTRGYGAVCWNCGKKGHIRRNCTEPPQDEDEKGEPTKNQKGETSATKTSEARTSEARAVRNTDFLLMTSEYQPLPDFTDVAEDWSHVATPPGEDKVGIEPEKLLLTSDTTDVGDAFGRMSTNLHGKERIWVTDSGATNHVTGLNQKWVNYRAFRKGEHKVRFANNATVDAKGIGDIAMLFLSRVWSRDMYSK